MVSIEFDRIVFKEGRDYVAYCPELDISSCGETIEHAKEMLKTAVRLFIEKAEKMGSLEDILSESNYTKDEKGRWRPPKPVATDTATIS